MSEDLGRIEKPTVESFGGERKLFVVPLIFNYSDAPAEFTEKISIYWEEAGEHLSRMEEKVGEVNRVYHEAVFIGGEKGLETLEKLSPASCRITRDKCQAGAQLEVADDPGLAEESMDWERCLMIGFLSDKVAEMITGLYMEATRKRYEHMARVIDSTLQPGEKGVLFIREGHSMQFPRDTQVFSVSPPALDLIHRWLRDRAQQEEPESGQH
jgi:hypothetical protein